MHKILWYFEIQTGHLISARRPDLVIVKNKRKEKNKKKREPSKQWNAERSPADLKSHAITQTSMIDRQLTLV